MHIPRNLTFLFVLLVTLAISAMADTTVSSPTSGAEVVSPFNLSASATTCSNQPVNALGYSLDSGADTIVQGSSVQASVESAPGLHTLHIKAWGNGGAECDTDAGVAVTPSNAAAVTNIQRMNGWNWLERNDPVVGGTSTGSTTFSNYGFTRQFHTTYTDWGASCTTCHLGRIQKQRTSCMTRG